MAILTGPRIAEIIRYTRMIQKLPDGDLRKDVLNLRGPAIDVTPLDADDDSRFGPNSLDVHLAPTLMLYHLEREDHYVTDRTGELRHRYEPVLDCKNTNQTFEDTIPEEGYVLSPGRIYLASTVEKTATLGLVPWLDGRSSIGRLGIFIHATAGRGDDGFGWPHGCTWTLEISVVEPVRIYPGLRIGQLTFFTIDGERKPYTGRYQKQDGPVASRLWQDGE